MDQFTASEKTAESIYNLFRSGRMRKHSFIQNLVNLARRKDDNIGAFYLMFLLSRTKNKYIEDLLLKAIKLI